MTEHTPTPWHRNIPPASKYNTIYSGRSTHVLHLSRSGLGNKEIEANADFIVRAVNAHDDLVAALAQIAAFIKDGEEVEGEPHEMTIDDAFETSSGAIDIARAALAKAKGDK